MVWVQIIVIIIFGMPVYEGIVPLSANSLQSGQFWAKLTASVHVSLWGSRPFSTVFIHVYKIAPKVSSSLQVVTKLEPIWHLYYHPFGWCVRIKCCAWMISVSAGRLVLCVVLRHRRQSGTISLQGAYGGGTGGQHWSCIYPRHSEPYKKNGTI